RHPQVPLPLCRIEATVEASVSPAGAGMAGPVTVTEIRPALRGIVHAAALPIAVAALGLLWQATGPSLGSRISAGVFGACLMALYGVSSSYHLGRFSAGVRRTLAKL